MKEIKVYEIELVKYIESTIDGIAFVVSDKEEYVAYLLDEYYEMCKEEIEKAIEDSGYCYCDYQINDIK